MKNIKKTNEFYEEQLSKLFKIEKIEKGFSQKYYIKGIKSKNMTGTFERYRLDNEYELSIFKLDGKMKETLNNPPISTNFVEIMYCLNGKYTFTSNFVKEKKTYSFKKGDIIIHRAVNGIKKYEIETEDLYMISIDVYLDEMISNFSKMKNRKKADEWKEKILNILKRDEVYFIKTNEEIENISREIENISINGINEYLSFKSKVFQFIILILNLQFNSIETEEIISENAKKILEKYQISELPNIKDLCKIMKISRYQLQRAFKNAEGVEIVKYLRKKKMEYAKTMLLTTTKSILEISNEVGYDNPSKFSETFKNYFGMLPNKYRKMHYIDLL
ncbi:AraC family transcriptional regulator [Leptotrichia sp. OH3620_COT-345]|uniref:helix-turn-helix domain-containing protein n=1 Tax=Leptotrichia sp. OH3620_COT-345 TaxID=2491048 RepID=UPI000F64DF43|nr:helix-turn-helix transcriptional regulator [Leptotrichia sp. OH3620_COT-345]RRD38839.1 AraC family transcriptional regulator [Leptotrichia sp. OH3620_COT-345]